MVITAKFSDAQIEALETTAKNKSELKKLIVQALETALDESLAPVIDPLGYAEGHAINMSLPKHVATRVELLAKESKKTKGTICRGLLQAYLLRHGVSSDKPKDRRYAKAVRTFGWTYRAAQESCYLNIRRSLEEHRVGMVEAATGTGKTYAMLLAANDVLQRDPGCRVMISCPTLSLIEHFLSAWNSMQAALSDLPDIAAVFGRQEFVSKEQILAAIDGGFYEDRGKRVRQWMNDGALPPEERNVRVSPWLAESLVKIAPDFPVQDVLLSSSTSDEDPGNLAYRAQFSASSPIVLCSHAMLAVDVRMRILGAVRNEEGAPQLSAINNDRQEIFRQLEKESDAKKRKQLIDELSLLDQEWSNLVARIGEDNTLLPNYQYLLVDEAHQLENAFSNVLSDYVSARKAVFLLQQYREEHGRKSGITVKDVERAEEIVQLLVSTTEKADTDTLSVPVSDADTRNIIDELGRILGKAKMVSKSFGPDAQLLRDLRDSRYKLVSSAKSPYLLITCSPVRRYPRIISGKPDVSQYLKVLWKSTQGAACLSATLYLPVEGGYSLSYQKECLSLPIDRLLEFPPISPEWLRTQVDSVWLPADVKINDRYWLRPPAMRDKLTPQAWGSRERAWLSDVAQCLIEIDKTARGGILVLLTAYSSVSKLENLLKDAEPALSDQLVVASRNQSLKQQQTEYLEKYDSGLRPIWLAIGGAWTGMDLSADAYRKILGKRVEEDWILTDLVIPRIPLGTNQSITHRYRMERRPAGQWDLQHAMFLLRQGIGRLIRDENLPGHRRIFLLDSRINDPEQKALSTRVLRILQGYHLSRLQPNQEFS